MPATPTPHCAFLNRFLQSERTIITICAWARTGIHFVATRGLKNCSPLQHREPRGDPRFEKIVAPLGRGVCIALRCAERRGLGHFLCNAAQTFGKKWETVCVYGLPGAKATNPKQTKKIT